MIARHAGTCPVCGRHFAKGRSKLAAPLALELPHDPRWTRYHRRGWLVRNGPVRDALRGSIWVHNRCRPEWSFAELQAEVRQRQAELIAARDAARAEARA